MAAACASCRLNQACNEIQGLLLGLNRAVSMTGVIPAGTGGVIGLARQHAQAALQAAGDVQRSPHPGAADTFLAECRAQLAALMAATARRCGPGDVPRLAELAGSAAWASWQVSWAVYGGYP